MNTYHNTDKDIHLRIYKFIINCFNDVVKKIPSSPANIRIISQISGSLTSMGANDQEADGAGSKKDFIAKYVIVRKETKETLYWLCLIRDTTLVSEQEIHTYIVECEQILKIVSSIIQSAQR